MEYPRLSVVICTHNPRRDYLSRAFEGLRSQSLPLAEWELLVVDNASAEPVATQCDLGWHPSARTVVELELGLTNARLRGIAEARTDLLVWVDDDNLLAPDYLAQATAIAREWPMLGVWGCGHFTPEWEIPPPFEFAPYLTYLAVGHVEHDSWSNQPFAYGAMPPGAGLCVRRSIALRYAEAVRNEPLRRSLGRKGGGLGACEDFDLGLTAVESGYGTGVFTHLRMTHLMPAGRVREDYLLRLVEGHAYSSLLLHHLHGRPTPAPGGWLAAIRRWRLHHSLSAVQRRIDDARRRGEARARHELSQLEATLT